MQNEFIVLKDLSIHIASKAVINRLNFIAPDDASMAVIGANGSGKSTLLKAICGILAPTTGELKIAGLSYKNPQENLHLRKLIGYAPDTPPLYPNDTIYRYLRFIAELKAIPKQKIQSRISNCLEIFDLTSICHTPIYALSKGTQQRVNLAQAIIHSPKILILDEPTNGLDTQQCANFCKYLLELRKQKVVIIIASHQYSDIIPICDYMLKIHNGLIEQIPTPLFNQSTVKNHDYIYY